MALDADTGERRWHYQFTPHDATTDSTQVPVLGELTINGQARKVVMFANRNGFFYTSIASPATDRRQAVCRDDVGQGNRCDRTSDAWATPDEVGNKTCPDLGGGTNFMSPSFDPTTKLFFVTARETCAMYYAYDQKFKPGEQYAVGSRGRAIRRTSARCARSTRRRG